jgi:hypothetical protein
MPNAQKKMESARSHRDELASQVAGYMDAGGPVPAPLRRRLRYAQERLDAARNAVREEARREPWRNNYENERDTHNGVK